MEKEIIAVVTGASRGVGKGIAIALGKTGATVYVTGRSNGNDSEFGGSVIETANAVNAAGGRGIPVVVDHADDCSVAELFKQVRNDHSRLDILVNNAAKLNNEVAGPKPFWEKSLASVDLITIGLRSHFVSSYYAAPLLIANGKGLIVNTGHYGAVSYYGGPIYGAQKAGADKMAADMAKELRKYNVAAISIWMGGVDTERARTYLATLPPELQPNVKRESPQFAGKVIAALYASAELMSLSGQALIGAESGLHLKVRDIDGSQPLSYRDTMGHPPELHDSLKS